MSGFRVAVDERHIARGVRVDSEECAIACALAEQLRGLGVEVEVNGVETVEIFDPATGGFLTADLPAPAAAFVAAFDEGGQVEPLAFRLRFDADGDDLSTDEERAASVVLLERVARRAEAPSWPLWAAVRSESPRGSGARSAVARGRSGSRSAPTPGATAAAREVSGVNP